MKVLRHKISKWNQSAYGLVTLGIALGIAISAVCVPPLFQDRGIAPVFATEENSATATAPDTVVDYNNVYAEDEAALHTAYLHRLEKSPGASLEKGALDIIANSVAYHGAAWGLREGRVDYINLSSETQDAELGRPNPHALNEGAIFKRPLDAFEQEHLFQLGKETPVYREMVDGRLRMLGLIPNSAQCAACHKSTPDTNPYLGAFSYHFVEIADD